ncbi:putative polyketide synthase [Talaromyces proteolyticus]|uniref:Polyketide synthase n=1 Tax=Talaromyces proteolyticus TaxID=1131652 RepID=A0AAD4KJY0_9EURO|nr:putative polyketide synthase [Talaromyces proteolyticus]KAH8694080.1 putative polyketide synthase [Talaromyces proteolyticus]
MAAISKSFIILFGDSSQDTFDESIIATLTREIKPPLLNRFLSDCQNILSEEYGNLFPSERHLLPFRDLFSFIQGGGKETSSTHPALGAARLVLIQLASFINSHEENPHERYPRPPTDLVIGLCLGELSAAAVAGASSLHELVPVAAEAVRLAFRVGNIAHRAALDLDGLNASSKSWSAVVSRESDLSDQRTLEEFQLSLNIPLRNRAYTSASSSKSVTISGPPSTLQKLFEQGDKFNGKGKPYKLPIYCPYHAPHLYSPDSVEKVIDSTYKDGAADSSQNNIALFRVALHNILHTRFEWELIVDNCKSIISSSDVRKWFIRAFGPTSAPKSLVSAIGSSGDIQVRIDVEFNLGTQSINQEKKQGKKRPLAIIGMAGRFPQASNPDELWKLLSERRDCHIPVFAVNPPMTNNKESRFDPTTHLSQTAYGCFIESPGLFDAKFFNMSPREALQTEPGQRLSLVTAYEALEMAGYVPNRTESSQVDRIGTFYGQTVDEYKEQNMAQNIDTYYIPGSLRAFGPGRINRYFKFGGPASSLDTACSSSSVAFNTACNSVWDGECKMAVVGGVNILTGSDNYNGLAAGHFLSSTGGCKTFDDSADGYCRAEGVASIVLKHLDDAERDNDNILGVVLSTATNYSADAVSITRPSATAQKRLYTQVLEEAGLRPSDVNYVEMHGTGTQAGDSCEINSVADIFAPADPKHRRDDPLYISAVKPNVGHSEAASGITSVIKALLALREQKLPPHIGIKSSINHNFPDLEARKIIIPTEETKLPQSQPDNNTQHVLINNFGAAGGNTAIIIQAPTKDQSQKPRVDARPDHIVNITAKSKFSLTKNIANIIQYIDENQGTSLSDLSYTTTARRIQHPLRVSTVASSIDHLRKSLVLLTQDENLKLSTEKLSKTVFAFTGQGSIYCSLGKECFQASPLFESFVTQLDDIAQSHGFKPILPVIDGTVTDIGMLTTTESQLAITAIQIALCKLWAAWGVEPDAVIGHSLGEYAALYASGVLTASDAIYLVGKRAELLENNCQPRSHAMLALKTDTNSAYRLAEENELEVACINGPNDFVLSGPQKLVRETCDTLKSKGIKSVVLEIAYGFHSSQVDPILEPLERISQGINFRPPRIPVISPVLNTVVDKESIFNPLYLRRHARETVNFHGALETALSSQLVDKGSIWLEIGPHPLCLSMIKSTFGASIRSVSSFRRNEHSCSSISNAVSNLFSYGIDLDWQEYHRAFNADQRLLTLPSYAWEEKEHWIPYTGDWVLNRGSSSKIGTAGHQLPALSKGPNTTSVQKLLVEERHGGKIHLLFESDLADVNLHGSIIGHLVNGSGLCPASIYADMALTAANYVLKEYQIPSPTTGVDVCNMNIFRPIVVSKNREEVFEKLHLEVVADLNVGQFHCQFGSHNPETGKTDWKANCDVLYCDANLWTKEWDKLTYLIQGRLESLEAGVSRATTHKLFQSMVYKLFTSCVDYDTKYQAMKEVLLHSPGLEASAKLLLYSGSEGGTFFYSPFWIDALVHLAGFVMNTNEELDTRNNVWISGGWGSMQFSQSIDSSLPYKVYVKMNFHGENAVVGDVYVMQGDSVVARIGDLNFHCLPRTVLSRLFKVPHSAVSQRNVSKEATHSNPERPQGWKHQSNPMKVVSKLSNSISDKMINIIAEEVGVSTRELIETNDFEKVGIDSLMSLQILSKTSTILDIELDQDTFQTLTTVQKLRGYVDDLYTDESLSADDSISTGEENPRTPATPIDHHDPLSNEDNLLATLVSIIVEESGMDPQDLVASEDLSKLGLDSLMSLAIIGSLEQKLGIEIDSSELPETITVSSLTKLVKETRSGSQSPERIEIHSQQNRNQSESSLSVPIRGNPRSDSKLAFLFPDGSGSAAVYQGIRPKTPGLCLLGLNSPFLKFPDQYTCTINDVVMKWVLEIRSRQPCGPYQLVGYSAGGYYAYEAAKSLISEGEKVSKLILIDCPCRTVYGAMPSSVLDALYQGRILAFPDGGKKTPSTNQDVLRRHFQSTIRNIEKYRPTPMANAPPTTLIWASRGVADGDSNEAYPVISNETDEFNEWLFHRQSENLGFDGWDGLLKNSQIAVEVTPGNHFTIMQSGNVESLSQIIEKNLLP